ncbi:MAG: flagellar hook-basal body complex protein [Planctomycetota bacterium]|nr:flagellar hook-basal body complex protein [Planctomycetota bacterium]
MGLTTALNTSLNGLTLNETAIEVIGNNIANASTNGFKSSAVQFTTQLSRTLTVGSAPQGLNGGTNPRQIGLGSTTAAIRRDFSQGAITTSTSPSDLAIEGEGFFVLSGAEGQVYSRNGNFTLNNQSQLINADGLRVKGYGIDDQFNIVTTQLVNVEIPLGKLNVAQETRNVSIEGAVRTDEDAITATESEVIQSAQLFDGTGAAITATTLLADISDSVGGTPLFVAGESITFTPRKGGADYDPVNFDVTATSTAIDFAQFLSATLGLEPAASVAGDPFGPAGVNITADGRFEVVANAGTSLAVEITPSRLRQTQNGAGLSSGQAVDLGFTQTRQGIGESTVVTFPVFDSLGEQVIVRMHTVLESKSPTVTTYRYYFESSQDSDLNSNLATGTFALNESGEIAGDSTAALSIDRDSTAAKTMSISVDLTRISGLTELGSSGSLSLLSQDGAPAGSLTSFNINDSGVVSGVFTNGVIRPLGQVVLARFANPLGLVEGGGGVLSEGVSSGPAQVTVPGQTGTGSIRSGAIELSNTDVGRSLVDLIVSSTNYRGNARVISSVQQLVDELLVLGR